jgi:hypothetical protein
VFALARLSLSSLKFAGKASHPSSKLATAMLQNVRLAK